MDRHYRQNKIDCKFANVDLQQLKERRNAAFPSIDDNIFELAK